MAKNKKDKLTNAPYILYDLRKTFPYHKIKSKGIEPKKYKKRGEPSVSPC